MSISFELFKVSKMNSLRNYTSSVMEKLETSDLDSRLNLIQRVALGTLP